MKALGHVPVLADEITAYLPRGMKRFIDGTVGYGGHSSLILKAEPRTELLGVDRDEVALTAAGRTLEFAGARVNLARGNFGELEEIANRNGWHQVDGVLLDVGVSSPQIDDARRGFSYRFDGPLDMRMDCRARRSARDLVNGYSEDELWRVFREYGGIRRAGALARAVVERRRLRAFERTSELVELCEEVFKGNVRGRLPVAALCFQALRIEVNDELGELARGLEAAQNLLAPGGRLMVVSFHSLEDGLVKNFFRDHTRDCVCPPELPRCGCGGGKATLRILTRKPIMAGDAEVAANSRAACAKLRVAEKIGP